MVSKPSKALTLTSHYLSSIDIFGIPNRLYNRGKENYTTPFGGFLTLLTVLLVIILAVEEIEAVMDNQKMTFNIGRNPLTETGSIHLDSDNFPIAIKLYAKGYNFSS